jgi:chemotaxis protein methyltransferase CheR
MIAKENDNIDKETENIEIALLLEGIYQKYGYDFRNYSKAHLKRRITTRMMRSGLLSVSQMQHKILYEPEFFHQLLVDLSLNTTEMFRDPKFFMGIREYAIPILKTYPFIKIWHAGCSTGEEVYSMAIVLKEAGILDRCIIYATDFNQIILDHAAEAIYSVEHIKAYSENYQNSGGKASLSDYFSVQYNSAMLDKSLKKNIVFADHNLVTDGVFGEMNMIICRNVLIYFNRDLQNKVLQLFYDSLIPGGILGIGSKETLMFSPLKDSYIVLNKLNMFKKKYD